VSKELKIKITVNSQTGEIKTATGDLQNLDRQTRSNSDSVSSLTKNMVLLAGAVGGLGAISSLTNKYIENADSMKQMQSQIKLAVSNTSEYIAAQKELFAISQEARTEYSATSQLYARIARNTKDLEISQTDLFQVTETISKSIAISGASAIAADAAIVQLGQGFASGTLRGEELNSVLEQTPRLAEAIAVGMGITIGQLRTYGAEGKITAAAVIDALKSQASAIDEEFKNVQLTVEDAGVTFDNSIMALVGRFEDATGATRNLSESIVGLSDFLDENQTEIVAYAQFTYATLSRTVDGFNVLYKTVENTAQMAVNGIAIITYGALDSISTMMVSTAEGLNSIGLASDETLEQNKKFAAFIKGEYNTALKSAVENQNEITEALEKFSPTIEDRIAAMRKEQKEREKIAEIRKKTQEETASWETKERGAGTLELDEYSFKMFLKYEEDKRAEFKKTQDYVNSVFGSINTQTQIQSSLLKEAMDSMLSPMDRYLEKFVELEAVMIKTFGTGSKEVEEFYLAQAKHIEDVGDTQTKSNMNSIESFEDLYGTSASLMNEFYDEDDRRKKKQMEVDRAIRIITQTARLADLAMALTTETTKQSALATTALVAQLQLPFPANIPAYAAVAGVIASLGIAVGGSGGGGVSISEPEKFGVGTSFGMSNKESESIASSLDLMSSFSEPQYQEISKMAKSMYKLERSMGNFVNRAIRVSGGDISEFESTSSTSSGFDTSRNLITRPYEDFSKGLNNILGDKVGGAISDYINVVSLGALGGLDKAIGSVFGGSTSTTLFDYGVVLGEQTVGDLINGFEGSLFQTSKTVKDGGWFHSDKTSYNTVLSEMDDRLEQDLENIVGSIYDSLLSGAEILKLDMGEVSSTLSNVMIEEAKISFNKSGDEIEEDFAAYISGVSDTLAESVFGEVLAGYEKVGEGLLETASRVATGISVTESLLEYLNNKTNFKHVIPATQSLIGLFEDIEDFADQTSSFYSTFYTDEEKLNNAINTTNSIFKDLGISVPSTNEEFKSLVQGLDLNTTSGQEAYKTLLNVADTFKIVGDSADSIYQERATLQQQVFNLIASENEKRAAAIVGLDQSNRVYQDFIFAVEDAQKAIADETKEKQKALESERTALNDYITDITSNISALEGVLGGITSTIDKLKAATLGSSYSLQNFHDLMSSSLSLAQTDNYAEYADTLNKAISASSVLYEDANFANKDDKIFAQMTALNQFGSLEETTLTQIDYLEKIEENTRGTLLGITDAITAMGQNVSGSMQDIVSSVIANNADYAGLVNGAKDQTLGGDWENRIYGAYRAITGRTPDANGMAYWLGRTDLQDANTTELYTAMARGANNEADVYKAVKWLAQNTNGSYGQNLAAKSADAGIISQSSFLDMVYQYGLGRSPDSGKQYWLDQNLSAKELLSRFPRGAEMAGETYMPFADGGLIQGGKGGVLGLIGEKDYDELVLPLKDPNDPLQMRSVVTLLQKLNNKIEELIGVTEAQAERIVELENRDRIRYYKEREAV